MHARQQYVSKRKIRILFYKEKKTLKKLMILFVALVLTATLASCGDKREANQKADADSQVKVLATVNDVSITEFDMKLIQKRIPAGMGGIHRGAEQNILQTLVRDELIYQKGLELGLDKNPAYRLKLAEVQAQLRALQQQEMAALYLRYLKDKIEVTDAETQGYFHKNALKMQTKFHIWEIFYRGNDAEIVKAYEDLKKGVPFEKVAARQFPPHLPKNMAAPWDLGDRHWNQIPEPWQDVLGNLAPGQMSEIIKGPRDRFWVIKLIKKTVDPQIAFATEKDKIVEVLKKKKTDELYEKMLSHMRSKAKIVFQE